MKILFSIGLTIGLCLYDSCRIDETDAILFASFVIVGNLVGLLAEFRDELIKALKK